MFQHKKRILLILLLTLLVGFCAGVLTQREGIPRQVKKPALKPKSGDSHRSITLVSEVGRQVETLKENKGLFFETNYYEAEVSEAGLLSVKVSGAEVIKDAGLFLKYSRVSERLSLSEVRKVSNENQKAIVRCDLRSERANVAKKYTFFEDRPRLDVEILIQYKDTVNINEERISYKTPLKSVRGFDHGNQFRTLTGQNVYSSRFPAYVSFSDAFHHDRSLHLLGNSQLALTIIDIHSRYSMIHLYMDSERAHPHPYFTSARTLEYSELSLFRLWEGIISQEGSASRRRRTHTHSASIADKGTTKAYRFALWFGKDPLYVRKQLQPFGREATLVWTEHSDAQCTESVQAVYLGTSDEFSPDYGEKGFVGNQLRVSKTAFAFSDCLNMGLDIPEYKRVTDTIHQKGIEIGPHTMASGTDGWLLNPGFEIFNRYYKSRFWVDHGSISGEINDEALAREGWDHSSDSYILDKLDRYAYDYVWAYWDQGWYGHRDIPKSFNLLYPDNMDQIPLMLWYLNRLDDNRTDEKRIFLFNGYQDRGRRDCYAREVIDGLIAERGVHVSHSYFCLVPSEPSLSHYKGQFFGVRGDVYSVNEVFESHLTYIRQKVDQGRLWNPTVSQWGDYINSIQEVRITYLDDRTVMIVNNNPVSVRGFSLAILGAAPGGVSIDGATIIGEKELNDDLILWFDMHTGQKVLVSVGRLN